jgi:hypothetical protein
MASKRETKRARRNARLRAATYHPAVKIAPAESPDDFRDFSDGEGGVREPRRPSPHAPEFGDALDPFSADSDGSSA